jgi:hypothetical protein
MASLRMGDQNLLSRALPCFGRHVKPLVPVAFAIVSTHSSFKEGWIRQAAGRKNCCQIYHKIKNVVPTPLSVVEGRKKKKIDVEYRKYR